jgi:cell wall-associated NlpC family hydrolase
LKFGNSVMKKLGALALSALILSSGLVAAPPQTALASHNITVGGKAEVSNTDGDTIRVREGAGTEFDQIAEAREGQVVSVIDGPVRDKKGNRWFKVRGAGGTGWIVAGFLEDATSTGEKTAAEAAKPAANTAAKKSSAPKIVGFARVANTDGDPLRVRSTPGTDGKVLTMFNPNTVGAVKAGPVTDSAGTAWYQISANGKTGWVMAQYLVQSKAPAQEPAAEKKPAAQEQAKPAEQPKAEPAAEKPKAEPAAQQKQAETEARSGTARGSEPEMAISVDTGLGQRVLNIAMKYVGYRYVRGGTSPRGFDCSGFTYYVYNQAGVRLSRDMRAQLNSGSRVSTANLQPGDLVFWQNTYKRGLSHVGIYVGNGRFVHAANEGTGVVVSSMNTAYWASRYVGASRPR